MPSASIGDVKGKHQGIGCRLNLLGGTTQPPSYKQPATFVLFDRIASPGAPSPLTSNASTCGKAGSVLSAMDTA